MKRSLVIGTGAVLIVIAAIFFMNLARRPPDTADESSSPASKVEVKVIRPVGVTDTLTFEAAGRVVAKKNHAVAALSDGKIKQVLVALNAPVKKGQVIALLENAELDSERSQAENNLELSRTMVRDLEKRDRDSGEMLTLGIISERDLVSLRQELNTRRTELRDRETAYERLKMRGKNYRIVSDTEGFISDILPEESFVTYGQTVAGIITLQDEQVEAFVPFDITDRPATGQSVVISSGGVSVRGSVLHSIPSTDANLVTVVIAPERPLPLKLAVNVTFRTRAVKGLSIPKSAVVMDEGRLVVYLVKDNKAVKKAITVAKDYLDTVVISDDLGPDAMLVTENAYLLSDGMEVIVK